jgi:hypothetical protein
LIIDELSAANNALTLMNDEDVTAVADIDVKRNLTIVNRT